MAFLEMLQEMLTRSQVSDLSKNVAVMNVERDKAGEPRKFLNFNYAEKGEIEWVQNTQPGIFMMKGKFLKNIYPKIKGQLGPSKFVDRDEIRKELEYSSIGAIQSDVPRSFVSMGRSEAD